MAVIAATRSLPQKVARGTKRYLFANYCQLKKSTNKLEGGRIHPDLAKAYQAYLLARALQYNDQSTPMLKRAEKALQIKNTALHQIAKSQDMAANSKSPGSHVKLDFENDSIAKHGVSLNEFYRNELNKFQCPKTTLHQIVKSQVMAANSKFSDSHIKLVFEEYRGVSLVDIRPNLPPRMFFKQY